MILLNTYYVPGTVLVTENRTVESVIASALMELNNLKIILLIIS